MVEKFIIKKFTIKEFLIKKFTIEEFMVLRSWVKAWGSKIPGLKCASNQIKSAFAPCATQRLFFPQILPEYNSLLYVDTDIIFLQDPFEVWKQLQNMEQKSFGLVSENDEA